MRKICLITAAVLVASSASAHAASLRGLTLASNEAPAATQTAPATTTIQVTNPKAQMVLKQLQAQGLIKVQPTPQPAPTPNVVTLPVQGQPAQGQTIQGTAAQGQVKQGQAGQGQVAPTQPATAVSQQPATQAVAPATSPSIKVTKPVVHTTRHRGSAGARLRRMAARYGIHW